MATAAGLSEDRSPSDNDSVSHPYKQPPTKWQKIESIIWDGGDRSEEERRLVRRLDIFIMLVPLLF